MAERSSLVGGRRTPVRQSIDLGAAAVGRVVGLAAREVEVERAVAGAQPERPRGLRQRGRHEVGREAHDAGRAVHVGAVLGEDVQRLRRAEPDAGPLEDAEHGVLVAVQLRVVVEADGEVRAERQERLPPAEVELRTHGSPYSKSGVGLEALHRVDRDVQHLGDVELGLHRPRLVGVGEVLHQDAAEAEIPADVVHRDGVAEVGDGAAELVGDVLLGLRKAQAPGHLHAGHQISGSPHPAHARGERV